MVANICKTISTEQNHDCYKGKILAFGKFRSFRENGLHDKLRCIAKFLVSSRGLVGTGEINRQILSELLITLMISNDITITERGLEWILRILGFVEYGPNLGSKDPWPSLQHLQLFAQETKQIHTNYLQALATCRPQLKEGQLKFDCSKVDRFLALHQESVGLNRLIHIQVLRDFFSTEARS